MFELHGLEDLLNIDVKTLSEPELLELYEKLLLKKREVVCIIDNLKSKLVDQQFGIQYRPRRHARMTKPDFSHTCRPRFDRI